MARTSLFCVISLLALASIGCVSSEKYQTAMMDRDQYADRLSKAEREKAEAQARADAFQKQLENAGLSSDQQLALTNNQLSQIAQLQKENAELREAYARAVSKEATAIVQLPEELNKALKEFAAANPDVVSYDERQGIVKFKSDVTFAVGSAVLNPSAAAAIDKFATILNSPAAAGYELQVVGHTDNVPVSNPATVKQGHLNNWYLSAHRAISVGSELQKHGISSTRLEVAGCADQRPIASNDTSAGRTANRRVEVLILPTTVHSNTVAVAPPAPTPVQAGNHQKGSGAVLNKDTFNKDAPPPVEPKRPVFNK